MADVFDRVISVPGEPQGAAFSTAALGMYALGIFKDIQDIGTLVPITRRYQPDETNHRRYSQLLSLYERIYWNLQRESLISPKSNVPGTNIQR